MTQTQTDETSRRDEEPSYTRAEFCKLEKISLSTYSKLKREGYGPTETRFPGMALVRITVEARRKWHAENEARQNTHAAKLEAKRRSELASVAGRKAIASENHRQHSGWVKNKSKKAGRAKAEA
jgi:hypothetical protein